jgi:hypothetical protein
MNYVEKLKSTQFRNLFKISKCSRMQSFNIFSGREGFLFEFVSLSGVWKFKNIFNRAGPTCQQPVSVLTARDGHPVPHAALFPVAAFTAWRALGASGCRSPPPHVGWPPLSLLRTSLRKPPPTPLFTSHH